MHAGFPWHWLLAVSTSTLRWGIKLAGPWWIFIVLVGYGDIVTG